MSLSPVSPRGRPRVSCAAGALAVLSLSVGCGRSASVQTAASLPLRRVVVYRNGVGYFEREGTTGGRTSLPNEAAHLEVAEGHSEIWTRAPSGSGAAKAGIIACALVPSAPCRLPAN